MLIGSFLKRITTRGLESISTIARRTASIVHATSIRIKAADVQFLAGSLSFTTAIAIVPLLAVSLSVFHAFGGFETLVERLEPFLLQNLVGGSGSEASRYIRSAVQRVRSDALGAGGVIGLLVAATKLFYDIEAVVQRIWRVTSARSFWGRLAVYWLIIFLGPLILAVALGVLGSKDLGLVKTFPKSALAIGFVFVSLLGIYKFIPACRVSWRYAVVSAALATGAVDLAQRFYAETIKNIFRYNKVYGSLASIPVFLIWVLVLWWVCLSGVALCATLEERGLRGRKA